MKKGKKSAGLKVAIILTIIFLVAFIGAFVAFGFVATYVDDADIDLVAVGFTEPTGKVATQSIESGIYV